VAVWHQQVCPQRVGRWLLGWLLGQGHHQRRGLLMCVWGAGGRMDMHSRGGEVQGRAGWGRVGREEGLAVSSRRLLFWWFIDTGPATWLLLG
jgi:hypothetical protein